MTIKRLSIEVANGRGVADRWRSQYFCDGKWSNTVSGSGELVYDKLCALGPNPDIDKIAEAIGNKSWSHLACSGCSDYVVAAVSFGDVLLCGECVHDASRAFRRSESK